MMRMSKKKELFKPVACVMVIPQLEAQGRKENIFVDLLCIFPKMTCKNVAMFHRSYHLSSRALWRLTRRLFHHSTMPERVADVAKPRSPDRA